MRPYEVVIIFAAELEDSVIESFIQRSLDLLKSNGATTGNIDRWGRRAFAYEVKHKREGYYVIIEFSAEPKTIAELDRFLQLLDEVLRHKIIRVPEKASARVRTGHGGRAPSAAAS